MCYGCYKEAGSPAIINEKTIAAAELVRLLYETEDGGVGGYGHIVFDDWNTDIDNINWCLDQAENNTYSEFTCEETRVASIAALKTFAELTEEERNSVLAMNSHFINQSK